MDIRERIFRGILSQKIVAYLESREKGVISGLEEACAKAREAGVLAKAIVKEGEWVEKGARLLELEGPLLQVDKLEDFLIGMVAKFSGVATAARRAVTMADGHFEVVCGAWKKMPIQIKEPLRKAIAVGGVKIRICQHPFIYLDKNYVRIFGGVKAALKAVRELQGKKVIQIRGETDSVSSEALEAVEGGASIIMVDTGKVEDLRAVSQSLRANKKRENVLLAFAGGISIEDIKSFQKVDVDILDIGRAIIDAPLLDISFEVLSEGRR